MRFHVCVEMINVTPKGCLWNEYEYGPRHYFWGWVPIPAKLGGAIARNTRRA